MERYLSELFEWTGPQNGAAPVMHCTIMDVVSWFHGVLHQLWIDVSVRCPHAERYHDSASTREVAAGAGETKKTKRYGTAVGALFGESYGRLGGDGAGLLRVYFEHLTARTIFSVLSVFVVFCTFTCTHVRVAQDVFCAHSQKHVHPHTMSLLGGSSLSSFCSTPPPTWIRSPATLTGIRPNPCATSLLDGQSGHLADSTPTTVYEPNFCIDVSSEHTPINFTSRRNSFNFENDLTNTVAASEDSDHLPQRSAASGSQHSQPALSPRCLVQGNEFVASVEECVLRRERGRD